MWSDKFKYHWVNAKMPSIWDNNTPTGPMKEGEKKSRMGEVCDFLDPPQNFKLYRRELREWTLPICIGSTAEHSQVRVPYFIRPTDAMTQITVLATWCGLNVLTRQGLVLPLFPLSFWGRVLHSPSWSQIYFLAEGNLKLLIFLPRL